MVRKSPLISTVHLNAHSSSKITQLLSNAGEPTFLCLSGTLSSPKLFSIEFPEFLMDILGIFIFFCIILSSNSSTVSVKCRHRSRKKLIKFPQSFSSDVKAPTEFFHPFVQLGPRAFCVSILRHPTNFSTL